MNYATLQYHMKSALPTFVLSILLTLPSSTIALATGTAEEDPSAHYRVLEWAELVPEGWEPPLIPPAHNEVEAAGVDRSAVVTELGQQLVTLPGYMRPVVYRDNEVAEFILVPYLPHQVKQHAHLEANQMVYVALHEPVRVENPMAPVWVVGTMTLDAVFTEEGFAAYSIVDALTTEYRY